MASIKILSKNSQQTPKISKQFNNIIQLLSLINKNTKIYKSNNTKINSSNNNGR